MGHTAKSTVIFVGLARLPQPCVAGDQTLAVELEIELPTRRILAVNSNLQLPGLARLLRETLVGACLNSASEALLELEVRYSAPFTAALGAALRRALQRATSDIPVDAPSAAPVRSREGVLATI